MQTTGQSLNDPDTARRAAAVADYRDGLARIIDPADLLAGRDSAEDPAGAAADAALWREGELLVRVADVEEQALLWRLAAFALLFLNAAQAAARWLP